MKTIDEIKRIVTDAGYYWDESVTSSFKLAITDFSAIEIVPTSELVPPEAFYFTYQGERISIENSCSGSEVGDTIDPCEDYPWWTYKRFEDAYAEPSSTNDQALIYGSLSYEGPVAQSSLRFYQLENEEMFVFANALHHSVWQKRGHLAYGFCGSVETKPHELVRRARVVVKWDLV